MPKGGKCKYSRVPNEHLMTDPKGNSEFCFPEALNVPRGEAEENIVVEGKQNSLSLSVFLYLQTQKHKTNCQEIVCLRPAVLQICRGFKEHDLITCESKIQVVVSLES